MCEWSIEGGLGELSHEWMRRVVGGWVRSGTSAIGRELAGSSKKRRKGEWWKQRGEDWKRWKADWSRVDCKERQ